MSTARSPSIVPIMSVFSLEDRANLLKRHTIRFLRNDTSGQLADVPFPPIACYSAPSRIAVITTLLNDRLADETTHYRDIQLIAECTPAAEGYFGVGSEDQRGKRVQEAAEDTQKRRATWQAIRCVIQGNPRMGVAPLEILLCEDEQDADGRTTYAFIIVLKERKGSNTTHPRIYFTSFLHQHYEAAFSDYDQATSTVEADMCLERILLMDVMVLITLLHELQHLLCDLVSRTSLN